MTAQILGTFTGIEYIEKISNGMINVNTSVPFDDTKNISLSSISLEKQNIKPLLNKILENKPTDAKVKIEITGNSLKSYISFYINDYSISTLELANKKIELITFQWSSLQNGEFISSYGRGRNDDLYRISWSYINIATGKPIIKNKIRKQLKITNKLLTDEDVNLKLKRYKENRKNRSNQKNRNRLFLLLKVIGAILLFVALMKFLK
jgi:hypothetical protein